MSRRSNVDLKDKYRNIQLSLNRFGYTFKKEKDGLGPPGHDYGATIQHSFDARELVASSPCPNVVLLSGILTEDGGDIGLIEQSSCNILRDLMNHSIDNQPGSSSGILESAMEMSGFAMAPPDHFSSQQQMISENFQYLLEYTQSNQQQQQQSHMQQRQLLDNQQQQQLQPMQLQHQDYLRENGMSDHITFQTMVILQ